MEYGRLGKYQPGKNRPDTPLKPSLYTDNNNNSSYKVAKVLVLFAFGLIVVSAVSVGVIELLRTQEPQSMQRVCGRTRYQNLCLNELMKFPGSSSASDKDMIHISVNMTLQRVGRALYTSAGISTVEMTPRVRSAYDDCLEMLEDSVDQLQRSLLSVAPSKNGKKKVGSSEDVMTWLSAALTNQDTCTDGLAEVENGYVKKQMEVKLKDLSQMVSNCLAIYAAATGDDFNGVPIQHRRRRLMSSYPTWLGTTERQLLQAPVGGSGGVIQPDIVVSKDGNGTCTTIAEAIKKAPEYSSRRIIIYVRAG
nr:probable pectinesterase/pectinesterase inhibitor 34 [Tanacetum cinerariifolium]GEY08027.1 probable pectinesterase/pectinesterase inhibitor 34 [Tanacetum cinerariifolium]